MWTLLLHYSPDMHVCSMLGSQVHIAHTSKHCFSVRATASFVGSRSGVMYHLHFFFLNFIENVNSYSGLQTAAQCSVVTSGAIQCIVEKCSMSPHCISQQLCGVKVAQFFYVPLQRSAFYRCESGHMVPPQSSEAREPASQPDN